jgi:hypothetical protein
VRAVLDALNWWSERSEEHRSNQRRHGRNLYEAVVWMQPLPASSRPGAERVGRPVQLQVQARNLSQSGISLLAAPQFEPDLINDDTPLLSAEGIFRLGRPVAIGLNPTQQEPLWIEGQVVRVRKVHQGFLEVGIRFTRRAAGQQPALES